MAKRGDVSRLVLPPEKYYTDPVLFIDEVLKVNQKGVPWSLLPHQRKVLRYAFTFERDVAGVWRLPLRLFVYSCIKKSGKSTIAAALLVWWSATRSRSESLVVANDAEQAASRVFKTAVDLCRLNGLERAGYVRIFANSLQFSSGTPVTVLANDYAGGAGAEHSMASFDELWAYSSERLRRLYEECTPPPTEENAFTLVTSYAGFENEGGLLRAMYDRAMQAERIDDELPVYRDGDFLCYWDHERRMPWQQGERGERYYAEQAKSLRPNQFKRLHQNEWTSTESVFITPELWDGCVEPALHPMLADDEAGPIFVGVDAATKSDCSAVVGVRWEGQRVRLVFHKIWRPSPGAPLNLEHTVEAYLREMHQRFTISVVCDPYQLQRSIATLKDAGLDIRELPQTVANTTAMGEALFDLLTGRNLRLYPSAELREMAMNAVAVESTRGWKIAKEKARSKIDGIVALAMGCVAALDAGPDDGMPLTLIGSSTYLAYEQARGGVPAPEPDGTEPDDEIITASEEEMAGRADRDEWERAPELVPRAERRRQHHANLETITQRDGYWSPAEDN